MCNSPQLIHIYSAAKLIIWYVRIAARHQNIWNAKSIQRLPTTEYLDSDAPNSKKNMTKILLKVIVPAGEKNNIIVSNISLFIRIMYISDSKC